MIDLESLQSWVTVEREVLADETEDHVTRRVNAAMQAGAPIVVQWAQDDCVDSLMSRQGQSLKGTSPPDNYWDMIEDETGDHTGLITFKT